MLYARNPGGAPANVAVAVPKLGARTAFLGKVRKDMRTIYFDMLLIKIYCIIEVEIYKIYLNLFAE